MEFENKTNNQQTEQSSASADTYHLPDLHLLSIEDIYSQLFEIANDGILIVDAETKSFIYANTAISKILGYTQDELIKMSVSDIHAEEDLSQALSEFNKFVEGEIIIAECIPFLRKDGKKRYVDISSSIVSIEEKTLLIGFVRDITERKQAKDELNKHVHALGERIKELNCLYGISEIVEKPGISLEDLLQQIIDLIPPAWQYPEITCARLLIDEKEYRTTPFKDTGQKQSCDIIVHGKSIGILDVCCLDERTASAERTFQEEEQKLLNAIAERLGKIIERRQAEDMLYQNKLNPAD